MRRAKRCAVVGLFAELLLSEAETLPVLTSMERQARGESAPMSSSCFKPSPCSQKKKEAAQVVDCMVRFRELCQTTVQGRLLELSSKAPQAPGLGREHK